MEQEGIIEAFLKIIPYMGGFFDEDISIALTDKAHYLENYGEGTMQLKMEQGAPIPEGGAARIALETGEIQCKEVPASVYGVQFKSYAVPLFDDNHNVCGCVMVARNIEKSHKVKGMAKDLHENMSQMLEALNSIATEIETTVAENNRIREQMQATNDMMKKTTEILDFVQGISNKSKLLGLNASIEAARANEAGRGFAVVAKEIEKMATSTMDSVKRIGDVLGDLTKAFDVIQGSVDHANEMVTNEAASVEELIASLAELESTTKYLNELANVI